ncbi:MAG: hypothetical protein KGL39_30555 [Patescibacteria group bacterium]|nr:hypothetical protein [Patescibacteria group bacterium]
MANKKKLARGRTSAVTFVRSRPWEEWWMDFATTMTASGAYKYGTVQQFIRSRTQNTKERAWLYAAIGPAPSDKGAYYQPPADADGFKPMPELQPIPWLGDWERRRNDGRLFKERSAEELARAVEAHATSVDVSRSVSSINVSWLGRFQNFAQQVDNFFGDHVLREELTLGQNQERAQLYIALQAKVQELSEKAQRMFLLCHGIKTDDDVSMLLQMTGMAATAALAGAAAGATIAGDGGAPADAMTQLANNPAFQLAQTMVEKARRYQMAMPQQIVDVKARPQ